MSDKDLLKQAIADAKTIRETAMANARLTLEEAFKPHLSSMITKRLRSEVEGVNETVNPGSSDIGGGTVTVKNPGPKEPSKESNSSADEPNPKQEVEPMGEGLQVEGPEDYHDIHGDGFGDDNGGEDLGSLTGQPMNANPHTAGQGPGEGDVLGNDHGAPPAGDHEQELDLEAIIRELESESAGEHDLQPGDTIGEPNTLSMGEGFDNAKAGAKVDGPIAPNGKASVKEAAEGPGVRDHKKVTTGQQLSGDPNGAGKSAPDMKDQDGVPGGKKVTPGQPVTEELDLEEILREMEAEEGGATVAETEQIATENVELKKSLREHREVIQFLRSKLHEVNTLNAKLLYTNKLFKNFNLNLEQKMKIVETFDRANTLREVKLVYTTLAESFNGKMRPSAAKRTAAITEGMASQAVGSTKPKSQQILVEGNDQVARWQKMAGIKPTKKES